ncbi:hypothetical protein M3J09_008215 [Ascochyta lentis]
MGSKQLCEKTLINPYRPLVPLSKHAEEIALWKAKSNLSMLQSSRMPCFARSSGTTLAG